MKKGWTISLLFCVVLLTLGACVSQSEVSNVRHIGLVTSGHINDKSFNQGTYEAINDFLGDYADVWERSQPIESLAEQDYRANLELAAAKNDVVVAPGVLMQNALIEVAGRMPERKFLGIDINLQDVTHSPTNLLTFAFAEEEAGYLVGIAAALQTNTDKVGYLGGMKVPTTEHFGIGFVAGVHAVNPEIQIIYDYTGTFIDAALGAQKATALFNNGVDVVFVAAGSTGTGVIAEAITRAQNNEAIWVIGVDQDQFADGMIAGTNRSVILTSAIKNVDIAVRAGLEQVQNEQFVGGRTERLASADGAVGIPQENPNLSADIKKAIDEARNQIIAGELVVPKTEAELRAKGAVNVIGSL